MTRLRRTLVLSLALGAAASGFAFAQARHRGADATVQVAQALLPPWICARGWGCPPAPPPPQLRPPPPPPAPLAPASPRTREFILYFDFDAATLTPDAQSVARQAAVYATQWRSSNVTVVAHTDTSGSVDYNRRLSERRAGAAAAQLISDGVPAGTLGVSSKGEEEPAVQTGDGVKEQLNRRAVVIVRYP
jgi:outer membrane protein OmpA-like peptidoglycan-associated protein